MIFTRSSAYWVAMALTVATGPRVFAQAAAETPAEDSPAGAAADAASTEEAPPDAADSSSDRDYDPRTLREDGLDEARARAQYQVGRALYDAGRYAEAAQEWEQAYALSNRPSLLFNAYLAYRDAGELEPAVRALGGYLESGPADATRLQFRYEAMRGTLESQQADAAARDERERQAELERQRLEEEREAQRQRAEAAENRVHPAGWAVMGVGGAIVVAGAVVGALALDAKSEIDANCANGTCHGAFDLETAEQQASTRALTADILIGVGAVAVVTGFALLFTLRRGNDDEEPAESGDTEAHFGCTQTGCAADVQVRF